MTAEPRRPNRRLRVLALVLIALAFAAVQDRYLMRRLLMHRGAHEPVRWMTSLPEAMAVARREKRPVYLDFFATWCGQCQEMLGETYTDPDVARRLNRDFVPVLIDIDKQPALAAQYSVGAIPDGAFLAPDGREAQRAVGFHDADEFLGMLDTATKAVAKLPPLPVPDKRAASMSSAATPTPPAPMPNVPLGFP